MDEGEGGAGGEGAEEGEEARAGEEDGREPVGLPAEEAEADVDVEGAGVRRAVVSSGGGRSCWCAAWGDWCVESAGEAEAEGEVTRGPVRVGGRSWGWGEGGMDDDGESAGLGGTVRIRGALADIDLRWFGEMQTEGDGPRDSLVQRAEGVECLQIVTAQVMCWWVHR